MPKKSPQGQFSFLGDESPGTAVHSPLADRLRPQEWDNYEGLSKLDPRLIAQLRSGKGKPPSLVLWGPPGSGKTTLARLIGNSYQCEFIEFSAVLVGVKDIRDVALKADRTGKLTILFVDEIHRLNKGQQDAFLPHVERGTFILIGATTENPSFYLNSALLSRMRVLVLESLSESALQGILDRGAKALGLQLSSAAKRIFIDMSGGDARKVLNMLEAYVESAPGASPGGEIGEAEVRSFIKDAGVAFYDRSGEEHYNMVSAFIKSMRGSDPDAALYWGFRMIESGEDPRFVIRRMMIFASEDIGNADPRALTLAVTTAEAFDRLGLPEGKIPIAHCITYLAGAPKSNRSYLAMHAALSAIKEHPKVSVPLHLRNAPTQLMKSLGYSEGYIYPHDREGAFAPGVQYLPDEIQGQVFYEPSDRGAEKVIAERLNALRRRTKPEEK